MYVTLPFDEQRVLKKQLFDMFGIKPFMHYDAQGFDQYPIFNAYKQEEDSFKKFVRILGHSSVGLEAIILSSHVISKIKINDDQSLLRKRELCPMVTKTAISFNFVPIAACILLLEFR